MSEMLQVCVGWDSGPYGIYTRYAGIAYGDRVVQVPTEVFERYERAEAELHAAEDALEEAIRGSR